MFGFHNRSVADLPPWSNALNNYYWRVRVEGRNKTTRRKFYRLIRAERLRLVELGVDAAQINAVCKYLVSMKQVNADRLHVALQSEKCDELNLRY